ncbi:ECF RNA polymerase sigma-E factor [bacterium BMS3Abin03]|nr:ECF RNA polymerase sigma-E factor [bacterium BMS3Abin03]
MESDQKNIIEFTIIFNKHKKKIYNYALRMVSDKMIAEDIVQNVFIKLYENLGKIRNRKSISFWLFKTARNEIYSYFRNRKRKSDFRAANIDEIEIHSQENIESDFQLKEMKELLLKKLDEFPEEQKEIFIMREYGGLSYKEISSILEINIDLVKSRLFKTRKKLMNIFQQKLNSEVQGDK